MIALRRYRAFVSVYWHARGVWGRVSMPSHSLIRKHAGLALACIPPQRQENDEKSFAHAACSAPARSSCPYAHFAMLLSAAKQHGARSPSTTPWHTLSPRSSMNGATRFATPSRHRATGRTWQTRHPDIPYVVRTKGKGQSRGDGGGGSCRLPSCNASMLARSPNCLSTRRHTHIRRHTQMLC